MPVCGNSSLWFSTELDERDVGGLETIVFILDQKRKDTWTADGEVI